MLCLLPNLTRLFFNRAIAFLSPAIISQWEKAASHSKKAIADLQEATAAPEEARAQPDPATATLDAVPRQQKMLASL
jgi:hypothetical protein